MDNNLIIYIIITVVIIFIGVILPIFLKKRIMQQLLEYIQLAQYDQFFKLLDSFQAKYCLKLYDREVLKLNGLLAKDDDSTAIINQFNKLMNDKSKDGKKAAILNRMFYYYLERKDEVNCKKIIDHLETLGFNALSLQTKIQYSVLLKHESKYINEVKTQLRNMKEKGNSDPAQMGTLEYLIGIQYYYANKKENARKYLEVAYKNLIDTPYQEEIETLLKELKK